MSCGLVVSRSVRDSALMLDCTHGAAPGDPYAAPAPARPFADEVGAYPDKLRIADASLADALEAGTLKVVAAVKQMHSGEVKFLG